MISFGTTNVGSELTVGDTLTSNEVAGIKASTTPITAANMVISADDFTSLMTDSIVYQVSDIATLEGYSGGEGYIDYVRDVGTFYQYVTAGSGYIVDHLRACTTWDGGDTRWVAVAGRYTYAGAQFNEVVVTASGNLTESQVRGTIINNYGQITESTQNLPAAVAGLGFTGIVMTTGAGAWSFKPASGEQVMLDGVILDANHKVRLATPALGDTFRALCLKYGASAWRWVFSTSQGTYDGVEE